MTTISDDWRKLPIAQRSLLIINITTGLTISCCAILCVNLIQFRGYARWCYISCRFWFALRGSVSPKKFKFFSTEQLIWIVKCVEYQVINDHKVLLLWIGKIKGRIFLWCTADVIPATSAKWKQWQWVKIIIKFKVIE